MKSLLSVLSKIKALTPYVKALVKAVETFDSELQLQTVKSE